MTDTDWSDRRLSCPRMLPTACLLASICGSPVFAAQPQGWHDGSDCSRSTGWVCDPDRYDRPPAVHFYEGTNFLGAVTADGHREAAVGDQCGGYAARGFAFSTPDSLKNGREHSITAYAIDLDAAGGLTGDNRPIAGTPKTISCQNTSSPPPRNMTPLGRHDGSDCSQSIGWVCDPDRYDRPLAVHFYEGANFLGAVTANGRREAAVGDQCGGYSARGFVFTTPDSLKNGQTRSITAYAINIDAAGSPTGDNAPLEGSSRTIQCSNAAPLGRLDGVIDGKAQGWAFDPDEPGKSIQVHLYADGPAGSGAGIAAITADLPSDGVNQAYSITGRHGFSYRIPDTDLDDTMHTLYAYAIDGAGDAARNSLLSDAPRTFPFQKIVDSSDGGLSYAYAPSMIAQDGRYHVFFCSVGGEGSWDYIRYAYSDDGINWSAPEIKLKSKPSNGRDYAACDPSVVYFNGYYYMYYSSAYETSGGVYQTVIQAARAATLAGEYHTYTDRGTWEANPGDPKILIYPKVKRDTSPPGYGAGQQTVVARADKLYLWYTDDSESGGSETPIYVLETDDPVRLSSAAAVKTDLPNGVNSGEVRYDPEAGGFLLVALKKGHTAGSHLVSFFSRDGRRWGGETVVKDADRIPDYSNNAGLLGDQAGTLSRPVMAVGFGAPYDLAKTDTWGHWDLYAMTLSSIPYATPPAAGGGTPLCGDGVCDEFERSNGVCAADCGSAPTDAMPPSVAISSPAAGGGTPLCGDGACDEFERSNGVCAADCGSAPTDATPPSVAISSPAGGATLSGTAGVLVEAFDDFGVAKVELFIDGATAGLREAAPWSFEIDTTPLADGEHVFSAKAYDAAGNAASSPEVRVMVANAPEPAGASAPPSQPSGASASDDGTESPAGEFADSPFGMHPAAVSREGYGAGRYEDAQGIGVRWERPSVPCMWSLVQSDPGGSTFDFSYYDAAYGGVPADINLLANISPAPARSATTHTAAGSYMPSDPDRYRAFVKAAVERYDGDGVDDMPGLKNPIRYWQVGNEPSSVLFDGFASLQRLTYEAIKEACPGCKVLIGGAGQPISPLKGFVSDTADYFSEFDKNYLPILQELDGAGFDIFDFHWYGHADGDYRRIKPVYAGLRERLAYYGASGVPVWVTEMGAYSGTPAGETFPARYQAEAEQASDYVKRYLYSASLGIEKIFAVLLMEGFAKRDDYFDHTGLIYDGVGSDDLGLGARKLSYYAYRKMAETLEGADWTSIETLRDEDGGLHLHRLAKDGDAIWVAWNDGTAEASLDLTSVADALLAVEALPRHASGLQVVDYDAAFSSRAAAGSVSISTRGPVYLFPYHDTAPPAVAVSSPAGGATLSGTVTVSVEATDDFGVAKVELFIDGATAGLREAAPWSFEIDTTPLADGEHVFSAKAYDAAGNAASSPEVRVMVANAPEPAGGRHSPAPQTPDGGDHDAAAHKAWLAAASCAEITVGACAADAEPPRIALYDGPADAGNPPLGPAGQTTDAIPGTEGPCAGRREHRFRFSLPESLRNGAVHELHAYRLDAGGGASLLDGAPQTLVCSPGEDAASRIGTHGGVLANKDLELGLVPGAVPEPAELKVAAERDSDSAARREKARSQNLAARSGGVQLLPLGLRLKKPAALRVRLATEARVAAAGPEKLSVYAWDPGSESWRALPSEVDVAAGIAKAETTLLSTFQVFAQLSTAAPPESECAVFVFPNPAKTGRRPTFHVECGEADSVQIRIYSASGRLAHSVAIGGTPSTVDRGEGPRLAFEYAWDAQGAGSGIYLYEVIVDKGGRTVKRGKFAFLR